MYDNFFGLRKRKCHWITKKSNLGFKDSEKIFRQKGNTVTYKLDFIFSLFMSLVKTHFILYTKLIEW